MNFNLRHFKFEVLTMHISSDINGQIWVNLYQEIRSRNLHLLVFSSIKLDGILKGVSIKRGKKTSKD